MSEYWERKVRRIMEGSARAQRIGTVEHSGYRYEVRTDQRSLGYKSHYKPVKIYWIIGYKPDGTPFFGSSFTAASYAKHTADAKAKLGVTFPA